MRDLCDEVTHLKQNFDSFKMKHVPRVCIGFMLLYKLAGSLVLHHRHFVK
jgi:hypothetical protein